jgi:hypothetical protein
VTKVSAYLRGVALSQALYKVMFEAAVAMLPPAEACQPTESMALECRLTALELADRLNVSRTTVLRDIKRLENHGWIAPVKGSMRLLGQRRGHQFFLAGDLQAKQATGEDRVASQVLGIKQGVEREKKPAVGRGLARRWEPDAANP